MSDDCEGCARREAQTVALANRLACYRTAISEIEHIHEDFEDLTKGYLEVAISETLENLMLDLHRIGAIEGLRVELDGKVLIEPDGSVECGE